jgi:PAS domain S-box-containing protein
MEFIRKYKGISSGERMKSFRNKTFILGTPCLFFLSGFLLFGFSYLLNIFNLRAGVNLILTGAEGGVSQTLLLSSFSLYCLAAFFGRRVCKYNSEVAKAKDELRESEALMKSIVLNIPAALFCKDYLEGEGKFVEWNEMAEKIWGVRKKDILGKTDYDFFPKEQADFFKEKDLATLDSNQLTYIPVEPIQTPDGKEMQMRTWKVPVKDHNGKSRYLLGISQEITKQIKLENELRDAKFQAENALEARTRFFASVSHEIRTPLNGILGISKILKDSIRKKENIEYLSQIQSCGNTLLRLVNDILEFSKMDSGHLKILNESFSIETLIRDVVDVMRPIAVEKGNTLEIFNHYEVNPYLIGDSTRIKQVLINLVHNAIKFTDKGKIRIEIYGIQRDAEEVSLNFKVVDSGIGMPDDILESMFESFVQADPKKSVENSGFGLGLSISKELVKSMGGEIKVKSELGVGSEFFFTLPLTVCSQKNREKNVIEKQRKKKYSYRALVAEDNQLNQMIAKSFLERLGLCVELVSNGREAIERASEAEFDFIFMDCQMPELDGYDASIALNEILSNENRPVIIAVSASATEEEIEKCKASGMNGFIPKPVSIEALESEIIRCTTSNIESEESIKMADTLDQGIGIDPNTVRKVFDFDWELFEQYLDQVISSLPGSLSELKTSFRVGDWSKVASELHKVRGSLSAFCGKPFISELKDFESIFKNHDPKAEDLKSFENMISRLEKKDWKSEFSSSKMVL